MSQLERVMVLDGDWASALAIVRALGLRGLVVHVGTPEPRGVATLSRYCAESFVYPDPMTDLSGFQAAIKDRLRESAYSLVIPVTDRTIVPLLQCRESLEQHAPLAIAPRDAVELALSKHHSTKLARRLGLPVPQSFVIHDLEELERHGDQLEYPLVLKPDRNKVWAAHGGAQDLGVRYASDRAQLVDTLELLLPHGPVQLQELVEGDGVGVGVLADNGTVLFLFQYRRLHEVPLSGGASSYRVSERRSETLERYTASLVEALRWHGVAMCEFKEDPETGKIWFLEMNGRFWGSLPLPVAADADFPSYLYDLYVHGLRDFSPAYREGLRCRSLSRELRWLREVLSTVCGHSETRNAPSFGRVAIDCLRMLNPVERWDVQKWSDPRPGLAEFASVGGKLAARASRMLSLWAECSRVKRVRADPRKLKVKLRHAQSVMIICYGNIMRSAYSEALLKKARLRPGLSIGSAGLGAREGNPADPLAVSEAVRRGLDLASHQARPLLRNSVGRADVILAMEAAHLLAVRQRFPEAADKCFLITSLSPQLPLEIPDPVFQGPKVLQRTFDQLELALEPLIPLLAAPNIHDGRSS